MTLRTKAISSLSAALCLLLVFAAAAAAQTVTTGNIAGTVTDTQGGVLPGATVTAVHTPTGTSYEAVTGADGRFSVLNVRVGPYTVSVALTGFKEQKQEAVDVALGQERTVDFKLPIATVSETVEVLAQSPQIDLSRAGTADNISNAVKESLPTISRSLTDIARISPLFVAQGSGAGDGPAALSVAGNSYRYNSLQIDGAVNNDLFGLASSAGTPGGTAETQPISLDAIQEIQLVVTPYDVRQGGFSGGGINAITKSGTNDIHGTAFFFGRNQDWVGKGVSDTQDLHAQGQAGRRQPRRSDHAEQGLLFRHGGMGAQAAADRLLRHGMRPDVHAAGALRSVNQRSPVALRVFDRPEPDRGVPEGDRQRQVFRARRLQPAQEQSAHDPEQLHQRVERHQQRLDDGVSDA